jgi:cytochrome c oxidase subunit III
MQVDTRSVTTDIWKGQGPPPADVKFGGGEGPGGRGVSRRASMTGLLVLLAAVVMFFAALTSAFIVRRGLSNDWVRTEMPQLLWLNTVALLVSSAALEMARRALKAGRRESFTRLWIAGSALGVLFLVGQYAAWLQLRSQGIYLATNPSSSFFYVLTAAHAIHLIGGVTALAYVSVQALRLRLGPGKRTVIDVSAVYWHFLDGLWVYLLLLLLVWG